MTPALLLLNFSFRRQAVIAISTVIIILSLPVIAVFGLGTSALSFLSSTSASTDQSSLPAISSGLYEGPPVPGDYYAWGNCTYWVFFLRQQAGDPIPTSWGNAATWAYYAAKDGYIVDHIPSPGAIMQISDVDGGLGHVAYVKSVDSSTGAWTISEMNVLGLDIVDTKTLPMSDAAYYNFIHDKS